MRMTKTVFLMALALCCGASSLWGDQVADVLRAKVASDGNAVIRVNIAAKQSFGGMGFPSESMDFTQEIPATVISPDGLAVASLVTTDPTAMFSEMMGEEMGDFQMQTKLSSVDYVMPDGSEIEAQIVLRDHDLDLAFLRPKEAPAEPMAYVDLAKGSSAQAFDQIIWLQRLGKIAKRECSGADSRISAVLEKPRMAYVLSTEGGILGASVIGCLGCPAFSMEGAPLGIVVTRRIKVKGGSGNPMSLLSGMQDSAMTIILPSADVLEVAAQAPMQAAEEPEETAESDGTEVKEVEIDLDTAPAQ